MLVPRRIHFPRRDPSLAHPNLTTFSMNRLSSNLIKPTIPHEPPPTLAEQQQRIPAWIAEEASAAFDRMTIDEGNLWSILNSYLFTIFPVGRCFNISPLLGIPSAAGTRADILIIIISKILPINDHSFDDRVVGVIAFQRDDTNYSEAAHQLISFMDTVSKRNGQTLKSYFLVGHECLVFKTGPGSQRVDVSRTHGPILNATNTGFLTTEMCRLARDHWNWD